MTVFGDASAVIKLYADEAGSAVIRLLESMYVAEIIRVEVPAVRIDPSRTTFATFDRDLAAAAASESFEVLGR